MSAAPGATPVTIDAGSAQVFAALLEARTGQRIAAGRSWRFDAALKPLLQSLGLDRVEQLTARLMERHDNALADRIVDSLLNQETSFFRDAGVIESAAKLVQEQPAPARVWCAACATGQEPLSLAMLFAEAGGAMPEIVATDVSAAAIARARAGSYSQFEIQRGLPIRRMMQWFESAPDNHWAAQPRLLSAISYRRHNLVVDPAPPGTFDLILCRNVLFYLAPHLREQVLERLAAALKPSGVLLLGAGETVIGQSEQLRPCRRARGFYERVNAPDDAERLYTTR
ncbi:protein-glutamate O-methyltransferase CheR [Sphingomonas sp. BK235]|jgi:chemotaxis protein methyltransferase CheR|uniref:CheR family methyltransferase n=1 Tax=Sphingomonas sp. BK235 TaxID=2512131 RepID=UPI001045DC0D|nr:protein-glutamate O-methyltransferase CheR [Sphingomonas sp. BK235]TCP36875.1 chemotaxis protein methyltransferase CheR [Sphingomonas sp. BK235]